MYSSNMEIGRKPTKTEGNCAERAVVGRPGLQLRLGRRWDGDGDGRARARQLRAAGHERQHPGGGGVQRGGAARGLWIGLAPILWGWPV